MENSQQGGMMGHEKVARCGALWKFLAREQLYKQLVSTSCNGISDETAAAEVFYS